MSKKLVSQIMQPVPLTVLPETSSRLAEKTLLLCQIPEVFIATASGHLLGIVPDYVFLKNRIQNDLVDRTVRELMVPVGLTVHPDDSVMEVSRILREQIHQRLPVVDQGILIGMVTRRAVLRSLMRIGLSSDPSARDTDAGQGRVDGGDLERTHLAPSWNRQNLPLAVSRNEVVLLESLY